MFALVGAPWLAWTCVECRQCTLGRENLCERARYDRDGGYEEVTLADERYVLALPATLRGASAAPLLCAGLIGLRALRATGDARRIGLYGFGAAAHIVAQIARAESRDICAFTRARDVPAQSRARSLGAIWAGASNAARLRGSMLRFCSRPKVSSRLSPAFPPQFLGAT